MEISNEVAAELAGAQDHILRTLEEHLECDVFLRGNVVTLDGDADAVQAGATVVRELSSMVERGHDIGPATIEAVARVLDQIGVIEKKLGIIRQHAAPARHLRQLPRSRRGDRGHRAGVRARHRVANRLDANCFLWPKLLPPRFSVVYIAAPSQKLVAPKGARKWAGQLASASFSPRNSRR